MRIVRKTFLLAAAIGLVLLAVGLLMGNAALWQPGAVAAAVGLALGIQAFAGMKTFQFTFWIVAAVTAGLIYPQAFQVWHGVKLTNPWVMLVVIQAVMFGMGTQMSLKDFTGVVKQPRGVLVGILCHFTIMPLVGFGLTKIFHFDPEIAAGIILIGSTSSGLASNVMAYIARANLGLSVTVTAVTTMLAPFITPLWMKLLAGNDIQTSYVAMMFEITRNVVVPISAALIHDYLKHASRRGQQIVLILAAVGAAWLAFLAAGGWNWMASHMTLASVPGSTTKPPEPFALTLLGLLGFFMSAPVVGVVYHRLTLLFKSLEERTPIASMFGIVYFTLVTTAAGQKYLLQIGFLLFLASVIHNGAGYFFGYWLSRLVRLDRNSARSVAFEVGLQNGGMATTLANSMGKLATLGLAAAIFSPWMNVSGSLLANYWRRKPVKPQELTLSTVTLRAE